MSSLSSVRSFHNLGTVLAGDFGVLGGLCGGDFAPLASFNLCVDRVRSVAYHCRRRLYIRLVLHHGVTHSDPRNALLDRGVVYIVRVHSVAGST